MINLTGKKIGVTGARGFIGKYVCNTLKNRGAEVFEFENVNLLEDKTFYYIYSNSIQYVIHLAGFNGGIEFNRLYPADIFAWNTIMAINVINACQLAKVQKVLSLITSCSYPDGLDIMNEINLHQGPPNEVVSCHGYAKRNVEIVSRMYRKQYGLNSVVACPNTVYGPGDRIDPNRTKVMTALIKKFIDAKVAKNSEVVCWGTGVPKREFIYVKDTAELLVRVLEQYDEELPINLATGQEYTIKELSKLIAQKVGYEGKIIWDTSKPNGAASKRLDVSKMKRYFNDYIFTSIDQGIEETIKWYKAL